MGLIFGGVTVQGNKVHVQKQENKEGVPRPIVFGTVRPIKGNVIASSEPRIVQKRKKSGGFLGIGGVTQVSEEVYRTYAIRICEGPITGITRVWKNNELVYNRDSTDPVQQENNAEFLAQQEGEKDANLDRFIGAKTPTGKAQFFLGGWAQQPSPVLQGVFGVDEVPPYRGTCYMVVDDENLTSSSGAIPQYSFEVERCFNG